MRNAGLIIAPEQYSEDNTSLLSEIVNEAMTLYIDLQKKIIPLIKI